MCHDIEDPTFDATAVATNPRARMRPVHRPPRASLDREPHCEWDVFIDADAEPLPEPKVTQRMSHMLLSDLAINRSPSLEPGGFDFYEGPVFEQLRLEQLSHSALVVVCSELAVQMHMLIASLMMVVEDRYGVDAAMDVADFQMTGSTWVISERLKPLLAPGLEGIDALIAVLKLHPALQPIEYFNAEIEKLDDERVLLTFGSNVASQESMPYGWFRLLLNKRFEGLEALVRGVDHRAQVTQRGEDLAWEITLDEQNAVTEDPFAVQVAKGTVLYQTQLENHIQLLNL